MSEQLDANKLKVLNEFRLLGSASKADIARRVELTHPAVADIVKKLCEAGYLKQEKEKRTGQRGQPATLYSLSDQNIFVGIHVGRRRLEFVGLDLKGKLLASSHVDVGFLQRKEFTENCQPELDRFLSRSAIKKRNVVGIGVSTPYFWEGWQEMLHTEYRGDKGWNSNAVTSLFRFPKNVEVIIENDGSSAALAELTFGSGANHSDFIYVNIGTFLGGGLVIGGTLRTGAHGNSGALGPFPVSPTTLHGSPRSSQPYEQLLGRASIHTLSEHAKRSGEEPDLQSWNDNGTPTSLVYLDEWVEDCTLALTEFFLGVWSIIDIETIILDGSLPRDLLQRIIDETGNKIQDHEIEGIIPSSIKPGQLGPNAQSVGAACLPMLRFVGPPPIDRSVELAAEDHTPGQSLN